MSEKRAMYSRSRFQLSVPMLVWGGGTFITFETLAPKTTVAASLLPAGAPSEAGPGWRDCRTGHQDASSVVREPVRKYWHQGSACLLPAPGHPSAHWTSSLPEHVSRRGKRLYQPIGTTRLADKKGLWPRRTARGTLGPLELRGWS